MCDLCLETVQHGELNTALRKMRVVDLLVSTTEDRAVGTLDIEHALKKGEKRFEPGVLAAAHRGILYVDEVNLLDDHIVDVLLDSAAMGVNTVEREGVSNSHPASFILVGTMNPEEGELRPQMLDRFGLCDRTEVTDEDVKEAAELVLSHRMRRKPFEEQTDYQEKPDESLNKQKEKLQEKEQNTDRLQVRQVCEKCDPA